MTKDLAMAFKDSNGPKKKANRDEECFNYHKLGHFKLDYLLSDRRLAKIEDPNIRKRINNRSESQIS